MKKVILFSFMIVFLLSVNAFGSPFLVCDPQCKFDGGNNCTEGYEISWDAGVTWEVAGSEDVGLDQIRMRHDLAGAADGLNQIEIRAFNVWGHSSSVPFEFTKNAPLDLNGVMIEP